MLSTAVVILNWNGKQLLKKFLPSVVKYSTEATVYVADNASKDGSVAFVKEAFPSVKIIQLTQNKGYAGGYNRALANLSEDIFILLNSDVEVTKNWLLPIEQHFDNNPKTGAVQPKILDHKRKTHFEYAGAAGGFMDKLGYPYCRGRIFDTVEEDRGQYDSDLPLFWASGACLAIRKQVFEKAGKLDETFFAHQEEIDLCWRVQHLGYSIYYLHQSVVYHVGGATLNAMHPKKTFYNFRNSLFNLLKNVPGAKVWGILFLRMVLDGVAAIQFLLQRKPRHFKAVFQAHMSFYGFFGEMLKKRRNIQHSHQHKSLFSIVFAYFLGKKKRYSDL